MTTRIVVVGHGMVGSRFVDDLSRRDPDHEFLITVLGAEEYEPYNRVLLSDVVAGKVGMAALTLPTCTDAQVRVLAGVQAVSLDRAQQLVHGSDGSSHAYDHLVLAAGSRARIPDLPGLVQPDRPDDQLQSLPPGVHPLRTLDDAREIVAATANAHHAVVLGAGVLGVEVACGLAGRGLAVTLIHANPTPMDRQLGADAGQVLTVGLDRLGVTQRMSTKINTVGLEDQRLSGVRLVGGEPLPADLLVLACGTVPETRLASDSGLPVDRGVVVGNDLTSPVDPSIFAIGDCAQPPEGSSGLIAQGWDQARQVAISLARMMAERRSGGSGNEETDSGNVGSRPSTSSGNVVRLKAAGLEVVSMGVSGERRPADPDHRTVKLSDPDRGRHLEIVVAGGLLVGATCVGSPTVGANLTAAFTRQTPLPADPAQLLLPSLTTAATETTSPTHIPDSATICTCNGVSKAAIVASWRAGARSAGAVADATRATTGCGTCTNAVCGIVDWLNNIEPDGPGTPPERQASHNSPLAGEKGVTHGKHHLHTADITAG